MGERADVNNNLIAQALSILIVQDIYLGRDRIGIFIPISCEKNNACSFL